MQRLEWFVVKQRIALEEYGIASSKRCGNIESDLHLAYSACLDRTLSLLALFHSVTPSFTCAQSMRSVPLSLNTKP
jgi:hypothetical protein